MISLQLWNPGRASKWQTVLVQFLEACCYAQDVGRSVWEFAIPLERLQQAGLNDNDLRWLLIKGFVDVRSNAAKRRPPRKQSSTDRSKPITFRPRTRFVLTEAGLRFAMSVCEPPRLEQPASPLSVSGASIASGPRWDVETRTLWLGIHLVKQFKVPAFTQETILAAFAEEGWPPCIDDPLPPADGVSPKRRLHDTINRLNRSHVRPLMRFRGNGSGRAVYWEAVRATHQSGTKPAPNRM